MRLISVIFAICLTGCASLAPNPDEWTYKERAAFAFSAIGHGVDLASSLQSNSNCIETNLILGEYPSDGAAIAVKALALGIEYAIYNSPGMGDKTHWFGFVSGAIHLGAGISNYQNDCY